MEVPLYLTSPLPGSHLVINDQGLPVYQTTADVGFTVRTRKQNKNCYGYFNRC